MADTFPPGDETQDPLAFFEPESDTPPAPTAGTEWVPAPNGTAAHAKTVRVTVDLPTVPPPETVNGNLAYPTASVLQKMAAAVPESAPVPRDMAVEFIGPPPPAGSVSFDHVCAVKELGFVEGVALIQATVDAVKAVGPSPGVPGLHGLFLTSAGDVVLHGAPTGERPARELARLLHQIVAPNLMPPAGRLFVGRWINNEDGGITEFASELAYFARPNGRELLVTLHGRCESGRTAGSVRPQEPRSERPRRQKVQPKPPDQQAENAPQGARKAGALITWIRAHKPELTAAAAVVIAATLSAIVTLLFAQRPVQASPDTGNATNLPAESALPPTVEAAPTPTLWYNPSHDAKGPAGTRRNDPSRPAAVRERGRPAIPTVAGRRRTGGDSAAPPVQSQDAARGLPPTATPITSRPDLRIYSAADQGVEPPVLRSAGIPEWLIKGFEIKQNQVELLITEKGEVQQARMIGSPQRMPDIMLISRIKEMLFDPALRNGVPVRYRYILSWNVTP